MCDIALIKNFDKKGKLTNSKFIHGLFGEDRRGEGEGEGEE
jgi:hypothetical protein